MLDRLALALLVLAGCAQAAEAMVLSCLPAGRKGEQQSEVYVDGFARGEYPPKDVDTIRVLARFGADVYEFFPEQTKALELREGVMRIHLVQPLSAGASAEIRFEGKLAAKKGDEFTMRFTMQNERRSGQGDVRCRID